MIALPCPFLRRAGGIGRVGMSRVQRSRDIAIYSSQPPLLLSSIEGVTASMDGSSSLPLSPPARETVVLELRGNDLMIEVPERLRGLPLEAQCAALVGPDEAPGLASAVLLDRRQRVLRTLPY